MALNTKSLGILGGVHPDLQRVFKRVDQTGQFDFQITEGLRSLERQAQLIKEGKSQLKDPKMGRHVMGIAVDVVLFEGAKVTWDFKLYYRFASLVKQAAMDEGVQIIWGGDWVSFKDGPHFELPLSSANQG